MTRPRSLRPASALVLGTAAALVLGAAGAFAYWTVFGQGTRLVASSTLLAPTGVGATMPSPTVRTVHVSWAAASPASPAGGNPGGYYVVRYAGTTPSPACGSSPAALLAGTAIACDDASVPSGTYTYVVTSVYRTWTAASAASAAVTVPGSALTSFTVVAPSTAIAGSAFGVTITARDQYGATFAAYTGAQCVTFSGPHASPSGTAPSYPAKGACATGSAVTFTFGVATASVTLVDAETTALTVTDNPSAKSGTSGPIVVASAAASKLAFTQQPSNALQNTAFTYQPIVAVQDPYGNVAMSDASAVTLAIATGTAGAVLTCATNPTSAVAGVATFSGCAINLTGSNYTLRATDGALASATSATFIISSGSVGSIAVSSGAGQSATVATAFASPLVALVKDTQSPSHPLAGVAVTFTAPSSGASGTFPGGATSVVVVTDANGLATAPALTATTIAGSYAITATANGKSATFSLTNLAGPATTITSFSGSGQSATVGSNFGSALVALVQDPYGNPVAGVGVTFTPDAVAVPTCTFGNGATYLATTDASGHATTPVPTASVDAGSYVVTADAGLATKASFSLTNVPGPVVGIAFTQEPGNALVGMAFVSQPQVSIVDGYGNVVTTASASITIAITGGTGTSGAVLACATNPLGTSGGIASFSGCSINLVGTGYTLTATTNGYAATSTAFDITQSLAPASLPFANAGTTVGLIEVGDSFAVAYTTAVHAATICSDWTSDTTAYAIAGVLAVGDNASPAGTDEFTLAASNGACGGALHVGYVDLGRKNIVKTSGISYAVTIGWNPGARTLTVTFGSPQNGTSVSRFKGSMTAVYYPDAAIADPTGGLITGTATYVGRFF